MSTLTWLDFSDAERRRALQVVELLGRSETRDELGLGAVRDAFAEALFPGMSTVQRRARYFLFVPWIFRDVERRSASRGDALGRARREELKLVEALLASADEQDLEDGGIIGARARARLRQVPSMIYWQGLARWGIRRVEGSREQWSRSLARPGSGAALDDDGQAVAVGASWWHATLPEPPDDWPKQATLKLREEDAAYLRERILERCAGTAIATLAARDGGWERVDFPWQLDAAWFTDDQQHLLRHARRFSELMHGAALRYNHALARAGEDPEREAEYRFRLEEWMAQEQAADRAGAPAAELWSLMDRHGARYSPETRRFVDDWRNLTADPTAVMSDAAVARVREREHQVKRRQARLSYDDARATWRGAAGAGQLEYRWGSTQRQLLDLHTAGTA